nr:hypothetical protein [Variovorax sp.]
MLNSEFAHPRGGHARAFGVEAARAARAPGDLGGAVDQRHAPMPALEQKARGGGRAGRMVEAHRRELALRIVAVEQHHADALGLEAAQDRQVGMRGRDQDAAHALRLEGLEDPALGLRVLVRAADDQRGLARRGHSLDALDHLAPEGIGHVEHDHADGLADAGLKRARRAVHAVARGRHDAHDLLARFRRHQVRTVDRVGDRGLRDADELRDVLRRQAGGRRRFGGLGIR